LRYERKYKLENVGLAVVQQVVASHPAGFRPLHPRRRINNIYFDTPDLQTFADNVAGIADRKKYRVRWYGHKRKQVKKPVLEVKIKQNQLGQKVSQKVQGFSGETLHLLTEEVNQKLPYTPGLRPVLANAYDRLYYGTSDKKFRITIDFNLQFGPSNARFLHLPFHDLETIIVELKYKAEYEPELDRITQYLPFRMTKSSKYVYGINLLYQ
jgi:SPX domain protein involved in polyphosphate accumulation